ncbi:MAG: FAD-binding oxidoreductase [Gemmatimonadota bacterium]|nr:FAD-binding oxidoreductase [Gemmatimonadota bacterium]
MTAPGVPVWERGGWRGLPPLEGAVQVGVCVVGLGGSGLAAVHRLLELGCSVAGVDAGMIAGGAGGRNGGFLLAGTAPFHHDAVRLYGRARAAGIYRLTLEQIGRMAKETPAAVRLVGSLRLSTSTEEDDDCLAQLEAMRADGLDVEPYEGPEGHGLLFPRDGAYDPLLRCRTLAEQALGRGARLFEHSAAIEISGSGVRTTQGRVECGAVVVAIDGRLEQVLPELRPRVRTARLQMLATAPTSEVMLPRPVYARYGYDYWQQLPDGRIALGGLRDQGGEAEWTDATEPSPDIQRMLERLLRDRVGVQAPVTHRWAAPVSYTDSGLPVLGEVRPGVWAAGAYSGTGNVPGALCGRLAAELATGGRPDGAALFAD